MNMELLGSLTYSDELSDVLGYVDEEGNEYALVGVYDGLSIVDISDPENPEEIFFGPGAPSIWRDIKTWGDYAYVSNESFGGIYIVDLSPLPDGEITSTTEFTGSTYSFQTSHNIFIDEFGKLYIFGANSGSGGAIICDLTQDPMNPVELGRVNDFYLHDGMARGDTLWGAAIYQGVLAAIDVSDPSDTEVIGTISTPSQFTHNAWVSDDGTHVFTTDEVSSGFVGAFNVENLDNMFETDRVRSQTGTDVIPHNVHVNNDFLVTSYYTDGIVVHDAKYPDKLIEVANFDTSPNFSGSGFSGSWGAYPFLPSGLILASDIEEGLMILDIEYIRAAFLEGIVTSSGNGTPLFNTRVEILGTELVTFTAFDGTYDFGSTISGTFDVEFSRIGYLTKVEEDVEIVNGEIKELNVEMSSFTVGVDEEEMIEDIRLYPNPFNESITIDFENEEISELLISVFNTTGKLVAEFQTNPGQRAISLGNDLKPGIYFVRVLGDNEEFTTKRIVKF
jgi:choice-of-anchor B domain-containing protein